MDTEMTSQTLEKYRTLGGWLFFFFVLDCFSLFGSLSDFFTSLSYTAEPIIILLSFFVLLISVFRVIFVLARKRKWLLFFLVLPFLCIIVLMVVASASGENISSFGGSFLSSLISTLFMVFYYLASARCSVYFLSDKDYEEALQNSYTEQVTLVPYNESNQ